MEIEWHQLELRYETLRRKHSRAGETSFGLSGIDGQQSTVVVVRGEQANRYVLIDGYKQVRALRRLGQDTGRASLWEIAKMDALIVAHQMKRGEPPSALEQGWLLSELGRPPRSIFRLLNDVAGSGPMLDQALRNVILRLHEIGHSHRKTARSTGLSHRGAKELQYFPGVCPRCLIDNTDVVVPARNGKRDDPLARDGGFRPPIRLSLSSS